MVCFFYWWKWAFILYCACVALSLVYYDGYLFITMAI